MKQLFTLTCLLFLSLSCSHRRSHKSPVVAADKAGIEIQWHKLKSQKRKIDFQLAVVNNTTDGVDLSKAFWKVKYGPANGSIVESDFDGVIIGPKSRRTGLIIFKFDQPISRRDNIEITIENATDLKGQPLVLERVEGTMSGFSLAYKKN